MKSYKNINVNSGFHYYRDSNKNEIDFINQIKGELHLIECKSEVSYNTSSVKVFDNLSKSDYKIGLSWIICNTNKIYKDNVLALPITAI